MPCTRYIVVCEGASERAYLQRLQGFLDRQPLAEGAFETALRFIAPNRAIAKGGNFANLRKNYNGCRKENRNASIQIWADFDLYHRNDNDCAEHYAQKTGGIPDFLFSFHNFEDFMALHWDNAQFQQWLQFGGQGHFSLPLHAVNYLLQFRAISPGYVKGALPFDFITWDSLKNLKKNKSQQPTSNPQNLHGVHSFADFLIGAIGSAYPSFL